MTNSPELVLYSDEHGTDLLIDGKHNVNMDWDRECLSFTTHTTRDGRAMEVQSNPLLGTYFVIVAKS